MARSERKSDGGIGEIVKTILYALGIAMVFRIFLFQPFSIPSSSMKPTLLIGDYLFVSKYAYGYSRYSIPFSPKLFEGRILGSAPERGDVIVFRNVNDENKDYIKRLIGLPGDRVRVTDGRLFLNGEAVPVEKVEAFVEPISGTSGQKCKDNVTVDGQLLCSKDQYVETLPNGVKHPILDVDGGRGTFDRTREVEVPAGHYFFLGDNRDNSGDSRTYTVGMVPEEALIGRAEIIFLSSEGSPFTPWTWRFSRFFNAIE